MYEARRGTVVLRTILRIRSTWTHGWQYGVPISSGRHGADCQVHKVPSPGMPVARLALGAEHASRHGVRDH